MMQLQGLEKHHDHLDQIVQYLQITSTIKQNNNQELTLKRIRSKPSMIKNEAKRRKQEIILKKNN